MRKYICSESHICTKSNYCLCGVDEKVYEEAANEYCLYSCRNFEEKINRNCLKSNSGMVNINAKCTPYFEYLMLKNLRENDKG